MALMLKKVVVSFFFIGYFIIGCFIFKDYGISWDEPDHRQIGYINFEYVLRGDKTLLSPQYPEKDHGPFIELPLVIIERLLKLKDTKIIYQLRHFLTFTLFYLSVIFFYLLNKKVFKSWKKGLLACILLVLSPRIFADSFYNTKDIPLLSFFIISTYTLFLLLEKKSLTRILFHSITSASLIAIRALGVIMPLVTVAILLTDLLINRSKKTKTIITYIFLTIILIVLFWPLLWSNPLNFFMVFKKLAKYNYETNLPVLYLGKYISPFKLPWYYIPIWIFISTPVMYSVLFLIGTSKTIINLIKVKNLRKIYEGYLYDITVLVLAISPVLAVIVLHSTLYDGWRHLYFIYPFMIILMIKGLQAIPIPLIVLTIAEMISVLIFMITYHPYQNVYFNILLSRNMTKVKENFELDYWGLSYRKALEYIVKFDKSKKIPLVVANNPGDSNSLILQKKDRKRLQYLDSHDIAKAKYFVSNYRWHPDEYGYKNEIFTIKVNGAKIMTVYKLY